MLPEAAAAHLGWLRTRLADYGADVRARLLAGLLLPSTAYLTGPPRPELGTVAVGARARRLRPARRAGDADRRAAAGRDPADYRLLIMPYNSPAALLGLPVTVVPCGFVDGLPVGLSVMGRLGEDGLTLAAAHAFQRTTDWHERRPVDAASGEVLYTTDTAE